MDCELAIVIVLVFGTVMGFGDWYFDRMDKRWQRKLLADHLTGIIGSAPSVGRPASSSPAIHSARTLDGAGQEPCTSIAMAR